MTLKGQFADDLCSRVVRAGQGRAGLDWATARKTPILPHFLPFSPIPPRFPPFSPIFPISPIFCRVHHPVYHVPRWPGNSGPCSAAHKQRPCLSNARRWFRQFLVIYRCLDKGGYLDKVAIQRCCLPAWHGVPSVRLGRKGSMTFKVAKWACRGCTWIC